MTPTQFVRIADVAFRPFMTELGFVMTPPRISGRSYAVEFERADHVV